uniref:molybdopterin cofactor-binding domain-containing protein n=1 Tax=Hydrogenophaga sp. TaxID=1904254 RepID=UPI0035676427
MNPPNKRPRALRRRTVLLSALGVGGALVVGWGALPPRSRQGSPDTWGRLEAGEVALNGWIKVLPDGAVVLAMPRSEMGQGVHTALPLLVAEELDMPLARVQTEQAGADKIYGNVAMFVAALPVHPQDAHGEEVALSVRAGQWMTRKVARELGINATGGSSTMADAWEPLRLAAATARAALLGAAALQWKLPVNELSIVDGVVVHATGKRAHFGDLAASAAAIPPGDVVLKSPSAFKQIGRGAPRKDIPSKVFGSAQFGLDVRLPQMVFASLRMAPELGG